jgi:NAD(P)-dependent dehydrogenase (short-subunit alcohol dehydrogenase family)
VSDEASVAAAFATARRQFGTPYVLVNNAGQSYNAAFSDTPREEWDRILNVNLTGTFLCIQQVLPSMLDARQGRIINIASTAGMKGYSKTSAYCASKHGIVGLTRSLAVETAKLGVTVNAVCPGYTHTGMAKQAIDNLVKGRGITEDEAQKMLVRGIPRGVLTTPEEVANAVAWLCSPHAGAITGQTIAVAGGEVM